MDKKGKSGCTVGRKMCYKTLRTRVGLESSFASQSVAARAFVPRVDVATGCVGIDLRGGSKQKKAEYKAPRAPERAPFEGGGGRQFPPPLP